MTMCSYMIMNQEMLTLLKGNMLKSFDFYKRDINRNQIVFDNKGNKSELIVNSFNIGINFPPVFSLILIFTFSSI